MLTVCLPFEFEKRQDQKVVNSFHIDYTQLDLGTCLGAVSDNCKDLLSQLLIRDPERRLTIE